MNHLATHTLLFFALSMGVLPGGQCFNFILTPSAQCCKVAHDCACCNSKTAPRKVPALAAPSHVCCAAIPGDALSSAPALDIRKLDWLTDGILTPTTPVANALEIQCFAPLMAFESHPPDIPLFLHHHILLV